MTNYFQGNYIFLTQWLPTLPIFSVWLTRLTRVYSTLLQRKSSKKLRADFGNGSDYSPFILTNADRRRRRRKNFQHQHVWLLCVRLSESIFYGPKYYTIPRGSRWFQSNRKRFYLQAIKRVDRNDGVITVIALVKPERTVTEAYFILALQLSYIAALY